MGSWRSIRLGDFLTLKRGYDLPTAQRAQHGNVPIVSSAGIIGFHDKAMVAPPGVVTGRYGTVGAFFYINEPFWPLNTTLYVQDFKGNHELFAYYLLQTLDFKRYSGKTSVPGVNRNDLHRIKLQCPPLPEQRKIAEIISTSDEAIAKIEQLIAALQKRKKGLIQTLLTGDVRFPGFDRKWQEIRLPEILSDGKGSIKVGPFGSQLKKNELVKHGYKIYGQENVYQNDFKIGDRYVDEKKFKSLKSCEVLPGDFLITMMGTIGKCAIVPNGIEKGIQDSHLIRLRINEKICSKRFLVHLFQSYELNKQVRRMSVGGIMEGLSSSIVQRLRLPITDLPEQEKIADALDMCDKDIALFIECKKQLENQKKGLMQRLLTGQVRVKV